MGFNGIYPLVICYIANWKDPPFYSWENPLFLWPFPIATLNYQRAKTDEIMEKNGEIDGEKDPKTWSRHQEIAGASIIQRLADWIGKNGDSPARKKKHLWKDWEDPQWLHQESGFGDKLYVWCWPVFAEYLLKCSVQMNVKGFHSNAVFFDKIKSVIVKALTSSLCMRYVHAKSQ